MDRPAVRPGVEDRRAVPGGRRTAPAERRRGGPDAGGVRPAPDGGAARVVARSAPLERVARLATTLLDVPMAFVSVVGEERHDLHASEGLPDVLRGSGVASFSHSLCRQVVAGGEPLLIADTLAPALPEARRWAADFGLRAYAGLPVRSRAGAVLGTVCVGDARPRAWTTSDTTVLEQLSEVAALELELRADLRSARQRDPLTGLPTGDSCERLVAELQLVAQARGSAVAVLAVDLTNLGLVVDGLGRAAGDQLVVAVARRLLGELANVAVGYLGAKRFLIISEAHDEHAALRLADQVREVLGAPVSVGDRVLPLVSCIGIALGEPGDLPAELIDAAAAAVGQAHESPNDVRGGGEGSLRERAAKRLSLDTALRRAIQTEEFTVHFQPLYDLRSGALSGFEALARWESPHLGRISPVDFIPVAETSGLIVVLGRQVLATACAHAAAWPQAVGGRAPGVSVNMSPEQLSPDLPGHVAGVLRASGLAPNRLTLELTETALVSVDGVGAAVLEQLSGMGVHLALDDFGTAFASLHHLASLPLDVLKIDRSFISRLDEPRTHAIVTATIAMAHSLRLAVTAEGIETEALRAQVTQMGCTHGQGYGLGHPADADAALALASAHALSPLPRG